MDLKNQKQNWIKNKVFNKLPILISGPCSAESEKQVLDIAKSLDKNRVNVFRAGVWKPRTRPGNFEGVGEIGLKWLKKVKDEVGFLTSTEVANPKHIELALKYDIDILWIGARSTASPFIIQEISDSLKNSDKIILVKNPINPDIELWIGALERLYANGLKKIGVIHRGFSTYKKTKYRNEPQWQLPIALRERLPNIPIICDPSHICGNRDGIYSVSQKAFNLNFDGLMIETHNKPDEAWSDAKQQITPIQLKEVIRKLELRKLQGKSLKYIEKLESLRSDIDELDFQLLNILTHRMRISNSIGKIKLENNVGILQSSRWHEILHKQVLEGERLGMSKEFIENIYKAIHQESINIQNKNMSKTERQEVLL
ncbi:bifunctional 3-deoxy-7-phosphoheptulonate synthase/chorismate mutase type II [Ichthyobacterium seriolicida]|uniref:chorismate mutase n=1 Tax=Ichthyobacterium seriolicida TaxID=242600 RepID=A0A1J1E2X4_9FLAO|nr:bifunctional 3-deoxy-7-phosphoheptulonate synthase/chorismate mutase type II [Ichthyobacterium seriolicida]BAV95301.1 cytochrome C4 [Ichthyobacterium seriolicida]